MEQIAKFDYYYGNQADQYSFYRIPKVLFTNVYFKKLTCEAKVLYGLLLDRMGLSVKNSWFDEGNRVYIIFTIENVMEYINCGKNKAVSIMAELDSDKGIGLIEKKRLGLGKANIIYVKNFTILGQDKAKKAVEVLESDENSQKFENQTAKGSNITPQEVLKTNFKKSEQHTSGGLVVTPQEVLNIHSNYTELSNTDLSDNNQSINQDNLENRMDEIEAYRDIICENIEYSALCSQYQKEEIEGIVEIMLEILMSKKEAFHIAKEEITAPMVKSRFMKINYLHIQYVFECLEKNTSKINNIKQYLLAVLYNAPTTIGHFYKAEVNHDLYGGGS